VAAGFEPRETPLVAMAAPVLGEPQLRRNSTVDSYSSKEKHFVEEKAVPEEDEHFSEDSGQTVIENAQDVAVEVCSHACPPYECLVRLRRRLFPRKTTQSCRF
jgi:hypothetical protein